VDSINKGLKKTVFILVFCGIALIGCSKKSIDNRVSISTSINGVKVTLSGNEVITHVRGGGHSTFAATGENSYSFTGTVKGSYSIDLQSKLKPIAILSYNEKTVIALRGYFDDQKWEFLEFKKKKLIKIEGNQIPLELLLDQDVNSCSFVIKKRVLTKKYSKNDVKVSLWIHKLTFLAESKSIVELEKTLTLFRKELPNWIFSDSGVNDSQINKFFELMRVEGFQKCVKILITDYKCPASFKTSQFRFLIFGLL
jgi:hypothetical protein